MWEARMAWEEKMTKEEEDKKMESMHYFTHMTAWKRAGEEEMRQKMLYDQTTMVLSAEEAKAERDAAVLDREARALAWELAKKDGLRQELEMSGKGRKNKVVSTGWASSEDVTDVWASSDDVMA